MNQSKTEIMEETEKRILTENQLEEFESYLYREEHAKNTVEKYMYNIRNFSMWCGEKSLSKELVTAWKGHLLESGYAPVTVNGALAALHCFFQFTGWTECRVKYLKVQRKVFRDTSKELNRKEFARLVECAEHMGESRLSLVMETICGTGIRVSEVAYITVEAVKKRCADVALKGKIRTILIPGKLARKLQAYAKKNNITSGEIFRDKDGKSLSRRQIWHGMKRIGKKAGVDLRKVFPHNLRHLFARIFYQNYHDVVQLADVLGHSSIDTTRIYLMTTGVEYERKLEDLEIVT